MCSLVASDLLSSSQNVIKTRGSCNDGIDFSVHIGK